MLCLIQPLAMSAELDFYRDVYPVLKANCISCHNKTTAKGDLNNNELVNYKEIKFRLQNGMWQRLAETEYGDHF